MGRAPVTRRLALFAAVLLAGGWPLRVATEEAATAEWAAYQDQQTSISYGSGSWDATMAAVMAHPFTTPLERMQASDVYSGSNARLRRVVNDLLAGRAITVAAIGGVATNGSAASQPGANDYVARYVSYLRSAFPKATITAQRKSAGVAPSSVVAACEAKFLAPDADLVLLEMVASDGKALDESITRARAPEAYELLLRRILTASKQPALILAQTLAPGQGNGRQPYYMTPEAPQYASLATYYNLGYASMRNAVWNPVSTSEKTATATVAAVSATDGSTPLDAGHSALADMLVFKTQRAVQDLALVPFGEYDRQSMREDVPRPMYPDVRNTSAEEILVDSTCLFLTNTSISSNCPSDMNGMCDLDYSSYEALSESYATAAVSDDSSSLSTGALIGIIVGAVGGFLLLCGLVLWVCLRRRRAQAAHKADTVKQVEEAAPAGKPAERPATHIVAVSTNAPPAHVPPPV